MKISKKKIEWFLALRFKNFPVKKELDVAIEVIQDFLNCDPLEIGQLQASTFDYVYNIHKEAKLKRMDLREDWNIW